jgi:DNA-binding transcriptional LysR family regulator
MPSRPGYLRYFVMVAEERQITRAAARLHIAQPALSQAMANLESELGVKLLNRRARGVSLTPAGEAFLPKARAVLAREQEAALAARSWARSLRGTMEVGFIGPPPTLSAPELFASYADRNPEAEVVYRDLTFPCGATASWLGEVDVAFCHAPALEPGIRVQPVRAEPRAVLAHVSHELSGRPELTVAEVLDETFVSFHPSVQPAWAGFHCLDDHRGEPPRAVTVDRALTTLQMAAIMTTSRAITTVPACDAELAQQMIPGVVAIPLRDAAPAILSLVGQEDPHNPLVESLLALARGIADPTPPP